MRSRYHFEQKYIDKVHNYRKSRQPMSLSEVLYYSAMNLDILNDVGTCRCPMRNV